MRKILQVIHLPRHFVNRLFPATLQHLKETVIKDDVAEVRLLLEEGVPLSQKRQTILHVAVSQGNLEMVRLISEKCPEIVDERNEDGDTAYMLAIFRDHRDIIQQLQSISDVSLCDNNGHNAFMVAAANGDLETLADLALNENAKVLGRNNEGQTALHRACFFGQMKAVSYLLDNTPLKVSQTDHKGNNSLHLACMGLNISLTRYLMKKVINARQLLLVPNRDGLTPYSLTMATIRDVKPKQSIDSINLEHIKSIEDCINLAIVRIVES